MNQPRPVAVPSEDEDEAEPCIKDLHQTTKQNTVLFKKVNPAEEEENLLRQQKLAEERARKKALRNFGRTSTVALGKTILDKPKKTLTKIISINDEIEERYGSAE